MYRWREGKNRSVIATRFFNLISVFSKFSEEFSNLESRPNSSLSQHCHTIFNWSQQDIESRWNVADICRTSIVVGYETTVLTRWNWILSFSWNQFIAASSVFIGQPLGSVLSAFLTDGLGRRKTMLLVNIPNITAWLLLARTNSLTVIYFAFASFGFGAGLCEAPIMTYLGEIWWIWWTYSIALKYWKNWLPICLNFWNVFSEPSIRGILMACAGISSSTGIFMVFFLGSIFSWRQVALICAIVPIMTLIAVFFVPETPIFLISKRRTEDALNSLRWLRGWVSPEAVANEFHELQRYNELSNSCASCQKQSIKCSHSISNFRDKFKDMTRKRTLKPFILITILYILMEFSGMFVMRPYIVQILNAYGVPLDANLTTVILGLLGVAANLCLLAIVKFVGKRKIYLWSMVGTFLSCFALSKYIHYMHYSCIVLVNKCPYFRCVWICFISGWMVLISNVLQWNTWKIFDDISRWSATHELYVTFNVFIIAVLCQHWRILNPEHYDGRSFSF